MLGSVAVSAVVSSKEVVGCRGREAPLHFEIA
jgi:hypothetical protein